MILFSRVMKSLVKADGARLLLLQAVSKKIILLVTFTNIMRMIQRRNNKQSGNCWIKAEI